MDISDFMPQMAMGYCLNIRKCVQNMHHIKICYNKNIHLYFIEQIAGATEALPAIAADACDGSCSVVDELVIWVGCFGGRQLQSLKFALALFLIGCPKERAIERRGRVFWTGTDIAFANVLPDTNKRTKILIAALLRQLLAAADACSRLRFMADWMSFLYHAIWMLYTIEYTIHIKC
ncbi:hypothetical protein ACJX0J_041147, partial [Zea mays]